MAECGTGVYVGLALTSLALVISVCLNITFYTLKRQNSQREVPEDYMYPEAYHMERNDDEEEQESQENPIYGNINPERMGAGAISVGEDVFYEHMNTRSRGEKPQQPDVAYASLDLTVGQKRRNKKRRNKQGQNRTDQLSHQELLEVEVDMGVALPSRTSSPMMSRNSIYLNSHQMAHETEELERERDREREQEQEDHMDFDAVHNDPTRFFGMVNHTHGFEPDGQ
ncbi:hypothetical protein AGOR_G00027380 [Albula goreensis]|uniref:Uncharacterized protein n=1 Tax=Albula goreensis TaxID=1534307 RepID=A0A8T3E5B2_9TELE|nr:hypothetical protein AGOR_G00027380 [Albula goreensis]